MELRVLHYFLMVAREGNITKAAAQLHLTQPTLSRQLMQLEEELETPLFVRGKRKIELTEAGMMLRRRAEEIVTLVEKTESEVKNEEMIGQIMIGTGIFEASQNFLPDVIEQFHDMYPNVKFDIYTGNADLIKERLDCGLVDVGILLEPVDVEKYNFIRLSQKETWGILISKAHPLAFQNQVIADDLKKVNLLSTNRSLVQGEISNWFKDDLEHIDFPITYNFISNVIPLIQKNMGAAITVQGACSIYHQDDLTFIPFYPKLETGCVIAWKRNQTLSRFVKKFIDLLDEMK